MQCHPSRWRRGGRVLRCRSPDHSRSPGPMRSRTSQLVGCWPERNSFALGWVNPLGRPEKIGGFPPMARWPLTGSACLAARRQVSSLDKSIDGPSRESRERVNEDRFDAFLTSEPPAFSVLERLTATTVGKWTDGSLPDRSIWARRSTRCMIPLFPGSSDPSRSRVVLTIAWCRAFFG